MHAQPCNAIRPYILYVWTYDTYDKPYGTVETLQTYNWLLQIARFSRVASLVTNKWYYIKGGNVTKLHLLLHTTALNNIKDMFMDMLEILERLVEIWLLLQLPMVMFDWVVAQRPWRRENQPPMTMNNDLDTRQRVKRKSPCH